MKKMTDSEKWAMLAQASAEKAVTDLAEKSKEQAGKITADLGVSYMVEVVAQLGSDAAAELLRGLPQEFAARIVAGLASEKAADLKDILRHSPGTAGSMMAKEYLHIPVDMNIADAIEYLHLIPVEKKGKIPYIYVHDPDGKLKGMIDTKDLVFNPLDTAISAIMRPAVSLPAGTKQEEVAKTLQNGRYLAVPIVDDAARIVGIVSADNALQAMKDQADKDIAKMVGMSSEEMRAGSGSIFNIMKVRLPWLFVNIVSGLVCAYIAGIFEHGPGTVTALFLFVPVVLGLSESTGIQNATIVVRNLTLGKVSMRDFGPLFLKETAVGVLIGVVCAAVVGLVTSVWQGSPMLGFAIGASLNISIMVSAVIGLLLPLVFKTFRIDPAMASGPLVLAICDIQTLMVYFNLAGYILRS